MKKLFLLLSFLLLAILVGCNKKDDNNVNENPGVLGDVGNEWSARFDGSYDISAKIVAKDQGILSLEINLDGQLDTIYLLFDGNKVSEFIHSGGDLSQPFTMVEFDCDIGDYYTFETNGLSFYREVIEKEIYYNEALAKEIPTIGVYEEIPAGLNIELFGVYITSIIWYWHPTYGLVCVDVYTSDGEMIEVTFVHIEL